MITTALVPGRKAPILVSEAAVAAMKPGSVIVDLAAEAGGNCALTVRDEVVTTPSGVRIVGTTNLPSTMPTDASRLYSRNVYAAALAMDCRRSLDHRYERRDRTKELASPTTVPR